MWRDFGVTEPDPDLLPALVERYEEPHRKYHTLQHLDACFRHLASVRGEAGHPEDVEMALWFHDAIYEIRVPGNEQKSADWAQRAMLAAGIGVEAAARVHALVMVTCHNAAPQTRTQEILLDVDLAILGAPTPVFDAYEAQIREEYAGIPIDQLRVNRRRILQSFLDRERIYHTTHFHALLEEQARRNLQQSIDRLAA